MARRSDDRSADTGYRKRRILPLLAILAIGLVLRLIMCYQLSATPFFHHPILDAVLYHERAAEIARGVLVGDRAFFFGPLYSYVLGLFYALAGEGAVVSRAMNIAFDMLTTLLVFLTARRCLGRTAALGAALLHALYLPAIYFTGLPLMASLVTTIFTGLALVLVSADDAKGGGTVRWFFTGILLGVGILARGNLLLLAPLFVAVVFHRARQRFWRLSGAFALGLLLMIGLSALHNYAAAREFIPLTTNAGLNFHIGNNPRSKGTYHLPPGLDPQNDPMGRLHAERVTGRRLGPKEVSDFYFSLGLSHIRAHPAATAMLVLKKIRLFWHFYEIPQIYQYALMKTHLSVLRLPLPSFLLVSPLALTGIGLALYRKRDPERLLAAAVGLYMISLLPFFITARYRLPVTPILIVLATGTLAFIFEHWREHRYRQAGAAAVPALIIAVVFTGFRRPVESYEYAQYYLSLGNLYRAEGRVEAAADWYEKALSREPGNPFTIASLGQVRLIQGDYARAVSLFEQAARANPDSALILTMLAEACGKTGDTEKGMAACRRILELEPDSVKARFGLVGFLIREGRNAEAVEAFRQYARLRPEDLESRCHLADHLVSVNEIELAAAILEEGLSAAPDNAALHGRLGSLRRMQGRWDDARRHLEAALRLAPDFEAARAMLEEMTAEQGEDS